MSQTQFFSMTTVTELMQSLSVEISIFSISFLLALAFRAGPFRKSGDASVSHKPGKSVGLKTLKKVDYDGEACCTNTQRKAREHSPPAQSVAGRHDATRALGHLLESAERWQGVDSLALYENVRSNQQIDSLAIAFRKNKQRALDFFAHLVQSAGRKDRPDLVVPLVDDMIQLDVERPLSFYESAMKMLASKKHYREAMRVYKHLETDRLAPSPVTLSCLISFAVELGELDQAVVFFDRLSAVSTPSIRACMSILRVHSKRKDWVRSLAVIRRMQHKGVAIDSLVLNIVLATGVGACHLEDAKKLLQEFVQTADVISYNTVLKGFAQQKDYASAVMLLDAMCETGVKPNAITFNTVMDAAVRNSHVVAAWRVLERMRDAGVQPDKFTCTTLMKGLQNGATSDQLHVVLELLHKIGPQCDSTLGGSLYRSVIDVVSELDDPALTARVVSQVREQKVSLSSMDNQRLVQLIARDKKLASNASP